MRTKKTYQDNFNTYFKADSAFTFWKARVALYAILKALGVGSGDEVILPGYTCVMDVNPIMYLGAKPVYVDIEPDTFNMNVDLLEDKITPATKVIIAQHTYGYVCDMDKIKEIASRHNVTVIEDCCLCFGSTYKGRLAGTMGVASYFSGQWNKPFTTGLGGVAIAFNSDLAARIDELCKQEMAAPSLKEKLMLAAQYCVYKTFIYPRTTAMAQSLFRWLTKKSIVVGSSSTEEFEPVMADDFFKGMSSLQARWGAGQLAKIDENIEHRRSMAALYDKMLIDRGWQGRKYDANIQDPVMVRYPVRISDKQKAIEMAASAGVELGSWFECPLHPIETPLEKYYYEIGMCPQAEKAAKEVVNLPLHPRAGVATVKRTVDFIAQFKQEC